MIRTVFLNEITFFLGIPLLLIDVGKKKPNPTLGLSPFRFLLLCEILRLPILYVAVAGVAGYGLTFLIMMGVVLFIYIVEVVYIVERRHFHSDQIEFFSDKERLLFALAHLGVINFVLDIPGLQGKSMKLQHIIILLLNFGALAVVVFGYLYIDTFDRAWGCYRCHGKGYDIYSFKSGYCASYTNYWTPNNGNTGMDNLMVVNNAFKSDNPKENPCVRTADPAGAYRASMPQWWHAASIMIVISLSIYLGMVPFKITAAETEFYNKL
jgi:hypothetical protein